jgi:hypothetical protein
MVRAKCSSWISRFSVFSQRSKQCPSESLSFLQPAKLLLHLYASLRAGCSLDTVHYLPNVHWNIYRLGNMGS